MPSGKKPKRRPMTYGEAINRFARRRRRPKQTFSDLMVDVTSRADDNSLWLIWDGIAQRTYESAEYEYKNGTVGDWLDHFVLKKEVVAALRKKVR